jgi:large subunit ribosomal protein L4
VSENSSIETAVVNASGAEVAKVTLPAVFGSDVRDYLLFEQVIAQQSSRRSGTAATKGKGEISGGGKKPWRQKGTGRARAGSSRSPIWRGGGTVHGPQPRSYGYRLPRSARRAALASALAQTKELRSLLETLGVARSVLVITEDRNDTVELSARNLPYVVVLPVAGLNVYDILRYENLLVTKDALARIEERLS